MVQAESWDWDWVDAYEAVAKKVDRVVVDQGKVFHFEYDEGKCCFT
jgi:hypothetical protein